MTDAVAWFKEASLERRAIRARRSARRGDVEHALELYASLVPSLQRLSPHRQLRLIGPYAELLHEAEGVLAFERLRGLAERAKSAYRRCEDERPDQLEQPRRQVRRLQKALIGIVRGAGRHSAFGRSSWRRARDLEMVAGG